MPVFVLSTEISLAFNEINDEMFIVTVTCKIGDRLFTKLRVELSLS